MKKILAWSEEKNAFVLVNVDVCVEESDDYALDSYGEMIRWNSDQFDKLFTSEAKLRGFASVLDDRLKKIRAAIDDIELVKKKITLIEEDMKKDRGVEIKDGWRQVSGDEVPF